MLTWMRQRMWVDETNGGEKEGEMWEMMRKMVNQDEYKMEDEKRESYI